MIQNIKFEAIQTKDTKTLESPHSKSHRPL